MKKYTLKKEGDLYRLFALRSFPYVSKGDKGGLVSGPHNLSHHGNCWIYEYAQAIEDAMVVDDAVLYGGCCAAGNALIRDKARVLDQAIVMGNCCIAGRAVIRDQAIVTGLALVTGEQTDIRGQEKIDGCQIIENNRSFPTWKIKENK